MRGAGLSFAGFVGILAAPLFAFAAASDIHFAPDGTVSATGITVFQKAGGNFFCRATWSQAFMRFTIVTNASTTFVKSHGEPASLDDIQEQDVIDVEGALATGGDSIVINSSSVRDANLMSAGKTLSGSVRSVDVGASSFVLKNSTFGTTTVKLSDGAQITKGARTIYLPSLAAGDKVLSASGTYDYASNTLTVSSVSVFQDKSVFTSRNFQGTLKSVAGTQLPTTVVVTVDGTDYTVALPAGAIILNSKKGATTLSRFVVGDIVRFWGAIRETDFSQVGAEILRDLNF